MSTEPFFGSIAAGMPPRGARRAPQQPAATFARRLAKPPKDAPLPSMLAGVLVACTTLTSCNRN